MVQLSNMLVTILATVAMASPDDGSTNSHPFDASELKIPPPPSTVEPKVPNLKGSDIHITRCIKYCLQNKYPRAGCSFWNDWGCLCR